MQVELIIEVIQRDEDNIVICPKCVGRGHIADNSFGSGSRDKLTCPKCEGSGRVVSAIIKAEVFLPYGNPKFVQDSW